MKGLCEFHTLQCCPTYGALLVSSDDISKFILLLINISINSQVNFDNYINKIFFALNKKFHNNTVYYKSNDNSIKTREYNISNKMIENLTNYQTYLITKTYIFT